MIFKNTRKEMKKEILISIEELKNFSVTNDMIDDLSNEELEELGKYISISLHFQIKASNVFTKNVVLILIKY